MNPTASDIATELEQAQVRATREASRQARAAVRQEVGTLLTEVEKLLRCVRAAAACFLSTAILLIRSIGRKTCSREAGRAT
jgi:hypothetical protein